MRTTGNERSCLDLHGRTIGHNYPYVPDPHSCTFCICTDGMPKLCKPVLCAQPTTCKSFRLGLTCCDFICLDDEPMDSAPDISLRYVASAISFLLVVSVGMFFIVRVRRRKLRRASMRNEDRRSLASIGYIGSGYEREDGPVGFPGLKPGYVPRGEAPPPYDEAIAQARVDQMRMSADHRNAIVAQSIAIENAMRQDEPSRPSSVHIYSNMPRSNAIAAAQQAANHGYMFNAPLMQPNQIAASETRELHSLPLLPPAGGVTFPTGSLSTIVNRCPMSTLNRTHHFGSPLPIQSASLHRTIPRFSTTADNLTFDQNINQSFIRASRLHYLEMRRSFHGSNENRPVLAENNSNSIPGNLDLTSRDDGRNQSRENEAGTSNRFSSLQQYNQNFVDEAARNKKGTILHLMGLFNEMLPEQHRVVMPELPTTVDKPSCMCYTNQPGDEVDADEYHSACENCKSANSSRWVLQEEFSDEQEEGTQTLQRRAPPSAAPPPSTATLPQPVTKHRSTPGLSSNWDNWFTAIPDSSSSDED